MDDMGRINVGKAGRSVERDGRSIGQLLDSGKGVNDLSLRDYALMADLALHGTPV